MAPKPKKKGRLSTSFRREKITQVHSGKKFKKAKKFQKKMRKSICDSSFSMSYLSPSNVSTPVSGRGTVGKRKAGRVSVGNESELISGLAVFGDNSITEKEEDVEPPAKKLKTVPTIEDIGEMFRNDHAIQSITIGKEGGLDNPPVSQTVMGEKEDASVIVIEDDDDDEENMTAVEELGHELMKVVEDEPGVTVPDTPRTVIKNLKMNAKNETIVLDDTCEEDDLIVVEDDWPALPAPLQPGRVQDVLTRYPGKAADFIPLGGNMRGGRKRGGGRNLRRADGHHRPLFTVGAPNTEFTPASSSQQCQHGVFRFTGRQENRQQPAPAPAPLPTMLVGKEQNRAEGGLRPIVIDGSNIAMSHGMDSSFSSKGIELVVEYFTQRGHKKVVAFVPQFRSKPNMSTDREVLEKLYRNGNLVYTASREVVGVARITSYDDRYILDYAASNGGVVVTRDNYRDLQREKAEWLEVVRNRILMPTFVGDDLMFPSDPLGRNGPSLDQFLKF